MYDDVNFNNDTPQAKYFPLLLILFASTWLISVISAVKTVSVFGFPLTGGFFIFPITALLNCLIVEAYGYKNARIAIWGGTLSNLLYILLINIVNIIPAYNGWGLEHEFQAVLIPQTRMVLASVISFWCSCFLNNIIMTKQKYYGTSLYRRLLFSSFFSLTADIFLFFILGILGTIPFDLFSKLFLSAYVKKLACEILLIPIIWKLIDLIKKLEGFEIIDKNTKLSPFSMDNVYELDHFRKVKKDEIKVVCLK